MSLLQELVKQYKKDSTTNNPNDSPATIAARGKRIAFNHFRILELISEDLGDDLEGYTHTQTIAATEWVITHNLNKYPQVSIMEFTGEEVIEVECDITHLSKNITKLSFSNPTVGVAYFN